MQRPFNHFDSELGHRNSRVDRASTWKPCMKRECSVSVSISPNLCNSEPKTIPAKRAAQYLLILF